jgi:uncharacterized membrane protein YfcA
VGISAWVRFGWSALTHVWSVDAATDPRTGGDMLWPVGALMVALLAAVGAFVVSRLAQRVGGDLLRRSQRRSRSND